MWTARCWRSSWRAYAEEVDAKGNKRVVLRLHPQLAPVKAAVFPLVRRDPQLVALAQEIYATLGPEFPTVYDESAAVGRRYRRQDEIGTPWCITVDRQSLEDRTVTVRERDSMAQERQPVDELLPELQRRLREPLGATGAVAAAGEERRYSAPQEYRGSNVYGDYADRYTRRHYSAAGAATGESGLWYDPDAGDAARGRRLAGNHRRRATLDGARDRCAGAWNPACITMVPASPAFTSSPATPASARDRACRSRRMPAPVTLSLSRRGHCTRRST